MTDREAEAARQLAAIKAKKIGMGRSILGLDPGTASTGISVIRNGVVVFANVIRKVPGSSAKDRLPEMCRRVASALTELYAKFEPDTVAMEWQMIRPDDPRPNDIAALLAVLGAAISVPRGVYTKLLLPLPVSWKGSIKSEVFTARVKAMAIGAATVDLLDENGVPQGEQHNGLDASALAAWAINQRPLWAV